MAIHWLTLPEHLWIKILQQLDGDTLLKTSLTCKTFNDLLENRSFFDKLKLVFHIKPYNSKIREFTTPRMFKRVVEIQKVFQRSKRNYRAVGIHFKHLSPDEESMISIWKQYTEETVEILIIFSQSVREIYLNNILLLDCFGTRLKERLINHKRLRIQYLIVNIRKIGFMHEYSKCSELLFMRDVDNNSRKDLFDKVSFQNLVVEGSFTIPYEHILLKQDHGLVRLKMVTAQLFKNDELSKVNLSLTYLDLMNANWTNKQHALNFIKTQTNLRNVYLSFDLNNYDILFIKNITDQNRELFSFGIHLHGGCEELFKNDIIQLEPNPSVKHFYYNFCFPQASLLRLFPSVDKCFFNEHFPLLL